MKKWLLLMLCMGWAGLIYVGYIMVSSAQPVDVNQQVAQIEHTMKLLDYKKTDAASKQIYQLFEQFPDEALKTVDEKKMFYQIELDIKQAFVLQANQPDHLMEEIYKLYLFVDALQEENNPLWKMQLMEIHQQLGAFLQNKQQLTETTWAELQLVYNRLYPSLYISASAPLLQKINENLAFLTIQVWNQNNNDGYKEKLSDLQADFAYLLEKNKKDEIDISFYLLFFFTGGTILSTLSYVAVRKYIGQKRSEKLSVRSKDL